jgi:hypothetical protein
MRKISISVVCAGIVMALTFYHFREEADKSVEASPFIPAVVTGDLISFPEGAAAEPPVWPENILPPQKVVFAPKKIPKPLPQHFQPLRQASLNDVTYTRTQEGVPVTIIWNRSYR